MFGRDPSLRVRVQPFQELPGRHDRDALERAEDKEVLIASHDDVRTSGNDRGQHKIIV